MRIIGFLTQALMAVGVMLTIGVPASATEALRRDAEIIGVASVIDGDTIDITDAKGVDGFGPMGEVEPREG